ncbi:hypothetical protein [uncultured Tenacibaculum sp.]|uniref:hypothetical protein n=1 Tax=uncultured Tenacibaculum sp. TaxID=174713 RepID=UPI002601D777|nr:hypothetical protein [uncultured Tenacibaculum sp.]
MEENKEVYDKLILFLQNNIQNKEDAYFNIFSDYSSDEEEEEQLKINANKTGLELFALELLTAKDKFDSLKELSDDGRLIKLKTLNWFNYEYNRDILTYVEPNYKTRSEIEAKIENEEKDSSSFGCILFLILLLVSSVVGFFEIISWFA